MAKPVVAIVGRPNVGKSALLNRLIQSREAIVEGTPGVTRDRIYRDCVWNGRTFSLVDTGGILVLDQDDLRKAIRLQVEMALAEADFILFVVDVRDGVHPLDQDVANLLRKTGKKIMVVANKADNLEQAADAAEFFSLGFGQPAAVSSVHGMGTGDLLDMVVKNLPDQSLEESEDEPIYISIVGRPNVGKSSLLNALIGQERAIVTDQPGTTRDIVDSAISWKGNKFIIVDTAGLRRKGKVGDRIEYYSCQRARRAIKRSDIGLVILDAGEPAVMQDKRIAGILEENGKGILIVVNKWDLAEPDFSARHYSPLMEDFEALLRRKMDFLSYSPIIFISALKKLGIGKILPLVVDIYRQFTRRVNTSVVNQVIREAFYLKPPPSFKGRNLKLYYSLQVGSSPPTFVLKVNSPKLVHFSYKRYIENQVRKSLGFNRTPLRIIFKK